MMAYFFEPPTVEEGPAGGGPLFFRYRLNKANTIIQRTDGSYISIRTPSVQETQENVRFVYQGGHKTPISNAERTDLIAAGYGANIIEE
jgi:predicted small secreted protein